MIKVARNSNGLMVVEITDGKTSTTSVALPSEWRDRVQQDNWLVELPLSLSEKSEGGTSSVIMHAFDGLPDMVIGCSGQAQAKEVFQAIQRMWLSDNHMLEVEKSDSSAGERITSSSVKEPGQVRAQAENGGSIRGKSGAVIVTLACVAVLGAAGFGSYKYVVHKSQPLAEAPALDLSKMSIDDVAKIDADPKFVQSIQSEMMAAVGVGKEAARSKQTEIEASHIEALKGMGLDPGTSMKSAAACLAAM